ncbi:MAG TPA: hypothetical protein VFQ44_06440 [Streptosporangiaceae bacterium]|nr:hypothetical protein [Streptosporangiaceae bacterium]
MNGLLSEMSSLLVSVIGLILLMAVVPLLMKIMLPPLGEPLWRGYWWLVRWVLLAPVRALVFGIRYLVRRR